MNMKIAHMENGAGKTSKTTGRLKSIMIATGEPDEQGEAPDLEHRRTDNR